MNKKFKTYYCKNCTNSIGWYSALYGSGLCGSCSHKGKKRPEHSKRMKGKNNPFFGKKHTIKSKLRISEVQTKAHKNHPMGCNCYGCRAKRLEFVGKNNPMFGVHRFGKESPGFIDGRTPLVNLIRNLEETSRWRTEIFERDDYTCQECYKKGCYLEAHHKTSFAKLLSEFLKEYDQFSPIEDKETLLRLAMKWQPFWNINNGKTLCKKCHKKTRFGQIRLHL